MERGGNPAFSISAKIVDVKGFLERRGGEITA
jgi:hypothetical protein